MRLAHLTGAAAIFITGLLWAQLFPALDNHVPEVRVTEVFQSGNGLKVTVQNISSRTISGLSIMLGKHRIDKDWSGLAGGGLLPNATASLAISTAGLPAGGTRHHPAPPGTLEVVAAAFTDGGPVKAAAAEPPAAAAAPPPRVESTAAASVQPTPIQAARKANEPVIDAPPPVKAVPLEPIRPVEPATVTGPPASRVESTPKAPPAPIAVPPPAPAGQPGTREQGTKDELAKLISLVEAFEPELASPFPRQALRKMIAAVVTEQNASGSQSAITAFDQGQRSALQAFAFGLQLIQDRRDLDDDTLRQQVGRFLRNQRQTLVKH